MSAKDTHSLAALFNPEAVLVHMGVTFSKDQELDLIRTGYIHYRDVDIEDVFVHFIGDTRHRAHKARAAIHHLRTVSESPPLLAGTGTRRPRRRGFHRPRRTRLDLEPGETRAIELDLEPRLLARWGDSQSAFQIAGGRYDIRIRTHALDQDSPAKHRTRPRRPILTIA